MKPKDGSSIIKFSDSNKSAKERLQAFLQPYKWKEGRNEEAHDATVFRDNCDVLIYLIYEAFWQYHDTVNSKKNKKRGPEEADLIEIILPTLEKVLQFLPDKINKAWHYNGIARLFKEIFINTVNLAPNDPNELTRKGIKLTILWILGLVEKCNNPNDKLAEEVFILILPEVSQPGADDMPQQTFQETVMPKFQCLMENLTSNITHIYWPSIDNKSLRERQIEGFKTVFNFCKKIYFIPILRGGEHEKPRKKSGKSSHKSLSQCISVSSSGLRLHSRRNEVLTPVTPHCHQLKKSSTSTHSSDRDTRTPSPLLKSHAAHIDDKTQERLHSNCNSATHITERCICCTQCKDRSYHRKPDCPITILQEVEGHFENVRTLVQRERSCEEDYELFFGLHDEIMKWFVKQGRSILPHVHDYCSFISPSDDDSKILKENENFKEQVQVCNIVDRVLFTDRENIKLMNDAFKHGPLALQRRKEEIFAELISAEEHQQFSFTKMIFLYYQLITNIKEYNKEDCAEFPEFLCNAHSSYKTVFSTDIFTARIKSFLKYATLNLAPLLRYPESYATFSLVNKKKIERLEVRTIGVYLVIVQQIKQADASACFRIILCMIKSIEHNHDKGIPLTAYPKQLSNLLQLVQFVGRKVILPPQTWKHLRALLLKLEKSSYNDTANEIWYEVMETLTYEIFFQVFGVEYCKINCDKDEKVPKTKGKLPGHIEEKSNLARFNARLIKFAFRSDKPTTQKRKHPSGERQRSQCTKYHYHGQNKVFTRTTDEMNNSDTNNWDDQTDNDDELRPNDGEHPIFLWRRFLSLKGNPNHYHSGALHKKMFESLSEIVKLFLWLDSNKSKQAKKRGSAAKYRDVVNDHPVVTYIYHILPLFFEAFMSNTSDEFLPGKKVAMEMLCKSLVRLHPIKPPEAVLHLFYNVLLNCLNKECIRPVERVNIGNKKCFERTKQDLLFEVVRGTRHIFSINLSGCQLPKVMGCLSEAAMNVLDPTSAAGPKGEAIIMLGTLYTYPWTSESLRQHIVVRMKEVAKAESEQFNRSKAIQMLGYMIMTMLSKCYPAGNDTPDSPTRIMENIKVSVVDEHVSNIQRADAKNLVDLIKIVMLQVQSKNSWLALSALSVVRDIAKDFDKLLLVDSTLPKQLMESLLFSLNTHMEAQKAPTEDNEQYFMKSSPNPIYDPFGADPLPSHVSSLPPKAVPIGKVSTIKSYHEAVITSTIMSLVDWILNIPEHIHNTQSPHMEFFHYTEDYTILLKTVFKVLQLVALDKPFNSYVEGYTLSILTKIRDFKIHDIKDAEVDVEQMPVESSLGVLPGSEDHYIHKNIKSCAEAALLVFCQRYHQFPLCGGPDYSSSMVYEYNREDQNGDMEYFNKEDVQMLTMDNSTIISLVELPTIPKEVEQKLDLPFECQAGFSRVIFRNVAGRFSWLSKRLFSLKEPPNSPPPLLDLIDHTENTTMAKDYPTLTPSTTLYRDNSGFPSSYHPISLNETIDHIKMTSGEIPFYRKLHKKCIEEDLLYNKVKSMLQNQKTNEENADNSISDTLDSITMSIDVSNRSGQVSVGSPFQQCRSLASSLDLLSWQKRFSTNGRQVELLDQTRISDKGKDICGELNELDNVFNREVHKFGLIYIAHGDEKREDVLSHNVGSPEFEKFVGGLGWEVNWKDLRGYVPTIGTDVMKSTTCHYADPTLEILFHVGTRLEPGNQEAALYRFKYIGNDYIGVIWSEHDRDVNIDTFKSNYLNFVIVIYPVKELKKCRVQVIVNFRKQEETCNIEHGIGPLFDGALVDRDILPDLVRKTIINADRSITVVQNRPRFYRDRAKALNKIQNYKRETTYEEFACELMSPSLINFDQYKDYRLAVVAETKLPPQRSNSRINKKPTARQSTGCSSQENMSDNERVKSEKKSNKWSKRESDSDNNSSKK